MIDRTLYFGFNQMAVDEFISSKMVKKVQKHHKCSWCAELIKAGEPAHRSTYKNENSLKNLYLHPECYQAYNSSDLDNSDGWYPGDFKRGTCECNE